MKQKHLALILALVVFFLLTAGVIVLAQTSASFDLSWHVVGSGGSESSSADYQINGTIGQSLASPQESDSADFVVNSGYWVVGANRTVYLPVVIKN